MPPICFPRRNLAAIPFPTWNASRDFVVRAAAAARSGFPHRRLDARIVVCGSTAVESGPVCAFDCFACVARFLAEGLRLSDRCDPERHPGGFRQPLFSRHVRDSGLCVAAGVHAFLGPLLLRGGLPLGAVQELVALRPVQAPKWIDHALGLLSSVYLGAAVLFASPWGPRLWST